MGACCKIEGGPPRSFTWSMVNWGALLVMLTAASENFALLCRETHQLRPSTYDNPWTAILYVDETQPGNLLSLDQGRKVQAAHV